MKTTLQLVAAIGIFCCVARASAGADAVWSSYHEAASAAAKGRKFSRATNLFRLAINEVAPYAKDDPAMRAALLESTGGLASVLLHEADYENAEVILNDAVRLSELHHHPDGLAVVRVRTQLAESFFFQGKLEAAEECIRKSIRAYQAAGNPQTTELALLLNNLAVIKLRQKNYDAAEVLARGSIGIVEKTGMQDCIALAVALDTLAEVLHEAGRDDDARPIIERAGRIAKISGDYARVTASIHRTLADVYAPTGSAADARRHAEYEVELLSRVLREDHPDLVEALTNLHDIQEKVGDIASAATTKARIHAIDEKKDQRK